MTAKPPQHITVRILGHEYQVACGENERESLIAAAEYLNQRMSAIQKKGKALGLERIAVMAALNMASELLEKRGSGATVTKLRPTSDPAISEKLTQLQLRIDNALNEDR